PLPAHRTDRWPFLRGRGAAKSLLKIKIEFFRAGYSVRTHRVKQRVVPVREKGIDLKNYVIGFVNEKSSSRPLSLFSWKPVRDEQMDGPNCRALTSIFSEGGT
ncbi:MAG: hypothetical protein WBA17_06080, partial [Saprospiraceae bacterium]